MLASHAYLFDTSVADIIPFAHEILSDGLVLIHS